MPERDPRPWKKGDKFSASHLNESVDNVRPLTRPDMSHSDGGAHFIRSPQGTSFHIPHTWDYLDTRFGLITSAGPSGEADFPDERYWVKEAFPADTSSGTNQLSFKPRIPVPGSEPFPVCVSNLPEIIGHTHLLATDETQAVEIMAFMDRTNQVVRWYMSIGGAGGMLYGVFIADVADNLISVHPSNAMGTVVDTTKTYYLALTHTITTNNVPPFHHFDVNAVIGYMPMPLSAFIVISGHQINGLVANYNQMPVVGKIGQCITVSANNTGFTTPCTLTVDWPVLETIP